MKNKLSYLIGVACLLCYTSTFTSCVNGVDDEYLEQKFTENNGTDEEGDELPDLNGDYSIEGDYELIMTCNGEPLEGKKRVMAVDETNESATITFAAAETDLESIIGLIPGANLIQGLGLKYTGNSPVPGEKEITITNVPLFRNYKRQNKMCHFQKTFCSRFTFINTKQNVHFTTKKNRSNLFSRLYFYSKLPEHINGRVKGWILPVF